MSAAQQGGGELPQVEVIPRAAWDDEAPDGMLESDNDYVSKNIDAAVTLLDAALAQRTASVPATGHPKCHKCFGNSETHASFCPLKGASVPAQAGQEVPVELVDAIVHTGRGYGNSETFRPQIESLLRHFWPGAAPVPAASVQPSSVSDSLLKEAQEEICRLKAKLVIAQNRPTPQPDIGRDAALEEALREMREWYRTHGNLHHTTLLRKVDELIATQAAPSDAGRDAALEEAARVCESLYSYPEEDGSAAVDGNLSEAASRIRALATQPAPEVASVPDAGLIGMAVSIDVSPGGDDAGNRLFGTVSGVQESSSDKGGFILLVDDPKPNFTQPAPAVLTPGKINVIADDLFLWEALPKEWGSPKKEGMIQGFARAVLAAAGK